VPERAPEWQSEIPVRHDQALLYRLSGDWNPLHADPDFAKLAGFDRPILHGLCTYGITLKAVVDTVLGGDAGRVLSYSTRFAGVFFPGETLRVRIWDEADRLLVTASAVERADTRVLTDTVLTYQK
jgi:acyl dehydratase